ncbi:ribosome silencing factor [Arcanobacterium sp. S3PF19]|uniref:ribosome silencing factor n=1 Tax=Arcanobacterium sp. S3PF19 TaxID=1219585 RepID=UPI00069125CE|nr:ribosome silencing factor [Arcanobacterium sp. S3PF19]
MAATEEAKEMAIVAARAAAELKCTSLVAIDVSQRLVLTDVFVVISGSSERQVRAIVDAVEEAVEKHGMPRLRREGLEGEAHWVLLDFGDIMVHVQQDEDREYYALEKLWGDCPVLDLPDDIKCAPAEEESSLSRYFDFSDLGE